MNFKIYTTIHELNNFDMQKITKLQLLKYISYPIVYHVYKLIFQFNSIVIYVKKMLNTVLCDTQYYL